MTDEELLKQITTIVRDEVKPIRDEMQGVEARLGRRIDTVEQTLSKRIDKVQESVDIVQEVMVKHHGMLITRVEALEEKVGTNPQKH